mgnify:CR=1 FL=1
MKKVNLIFVSVLAVLFSFPSGRSGWALAQNIGINTTGVPGNSSALLDVDDGVANNVGLLIPRIALTDVATQAPIGGTAPASLIVYNTSTTTTNGSGAGYYYWSGTKWIYLPAPSNSPGISGDVLLSGGVNASPQWQNPSVLGTGGGGGGSALGTAMMTAYMDSIGLFTPHANNCVVATEAFVPLFTGCTVGYCIEKSERTAAYWTNAVRTCLAAGKRLPESFEWQVACDNAGALGILTMTGNWEWASNFALPMYVVAGGGVCASVAGLTCNYVAWSWLGDNTGTRSSFTFRCVH